MKKKKKMEKMGRNFQN